MQQAKQASLQAAKTYAHKTKRQKWQLARTTGSHTASTQRSQAHHPHFPR
jgi:hypothetical protein